MRAWITLAMLLTVGLAGCAGDADEPVEEQFEDFEEPLEATETTGVIRGVVVDPSITPIADVQVTVQGTELSATTDDEGRFAFSDLEAGVYFLQAKRLGYTESQTSVEVVAGVDKPPVTRLLIERIPGSEPYATPLHIDGLMVCSAQVAIVFMTGCMVGAYTDDHSRNYFDVDGTPDFVQAELTWKTTQTLAQDACMRNYSSTGLGGTTLVSDSCGASPRVQRIEGARLNETDVGAGRGIENVVWVSPLGAGGVPVLGVAIDQPFDVYVHLFHNFTPAEDWLFVEDGDPVPPQ